VIFVFYTVKIRLWLYSFSLTRPSLNVPSAAYLPFPADYTHTNDTMSFRELRSTSK